MRPKLGSNESLSEMPENSRVTKQRMESSENPQFILIEEMPGIGKYFLLKEIAYNWGIKKLLQKFKLVLLMQLCDPVIQKMTNFYDLLKLFCRRDWKATEITHECSKSIMKNDGEYVVYLLDGFDELSKALHRDSLITD